MNAQAIGCWGPGSQAPGRLRRWTPRQPGGQPQWPAGQRRRAYGFLAWLLLGVLLAGWPTTPSAQAAERRVALLLANQAYAAGALHYPLQDVAQIRTALMAIGFQDRDVLVVANADQKQMKRALSDFGRRATGADVAFVYYSGHATQALGQNWLIPLGADIRQEADYELEAVSAQALLSQLQAA